MCKLNKIQNKEFYIYFLNKENYIGITTDINKRMLKHKSKSNFDVSDLIILEKTFDLQYALKKELEYQNFYKCSLGVRNQYGSKNPYAKTVLCLKTGIFYDTIKEACIALNYNYSCVRSYISDKENKYSLIKI